MVYFSHAPVHWGRTKLRGQQERDHTTLQRPQGKQGLTLEPKWGRATIKPRPRKRSWGRSENFKFCPIQLLTHFASNTSVSGNRKHLGKARLGHSVCIVGFIVVAVVFMVVAFVVFIVFVVAVFIVVVIAVWRIRKHLNLGFAGLKGHGRRFVSELVPGILTPPSPPPGNHPPNHSLGQIPQPLFALICVGGCMGEGGRKGGEGVCVGCGVRSCTAL